ncbi:hypothetical protein R5R35_011071 [Gryllus longicercus]|uniref:G-protein coupled receptors family 1 profile domain-containing protein n=1 Tax=Gryllus longicercus TaxID=2509291 RepID=A0AAN9Z6I9_9ORTH
MIPTALPAAPDNATGDAGASLFFSQNGSAGAVPPPTPAFPPYIRFASTAVCALIMAVGVVGNVLVPLVILRARDLRNSTNIFLVNLSAADLLVLLVCAPAALVEVHSPPEVWVLGAAMCKTVPFVEMTVAHASVLTILAISFERYYAICEPLRAGYVCTKARAAGLCGLAWLLAAVLTSPVLQISHFAYYEYPGGSRVPACHTRVDTVESAAFFVATISVFFALPLLLLVGLYAAIARRLRAPAASAAAATPARAPSPPPAAAAAAAACAAAARVSGGVAGAAGAARARRQVVVMLGAVVACFFVCLLPFRALTLWIVSVPKESLQALGFERYFNILSFCRAMTYLNSAVNPILYNLMSSKFRAGFLRLCCEGRVGGGLGRGRGRGRGRRGTEGTRLTASSWLSRTSSRRALGFPRLLRADATPPPTPPAHARSRAAVPAAPATPPTHSPTPDRKQAIAALADAGADADAGKGAEIYV